MQLESNVKFVLVFMRMRKKRQGVLLMKLVENVLCVDEDAPPA